ncbi:MAG: type III pantothenate kinase [Rhodospirillales bacterium]|nr:type III pantothenate kinase [Alphaproteobacteria bacterium]MCB9987355.1 type III pantothenate kinase [Rhodospirillales bacterium]USO07796.1 MAG: type III pantothenate kinase [Rhodospirillales bacterium]
MLLAIDAGNTNTVCALIAPGAENPAALWRIRTEAARTADEYAAWMLPLAQAAGLDLRSVDGVIVASVVPEANFALRRFCETYIGISPAFVGEAGVEAGIPVHLPRPEEVGADRLVNALAARAKYRLPCVIIDFGTATTFDVVDAGGAYVGGVIAPGVNLSLDALHRAAAKLPRIAVARPDRVIGTDTVSAMRSGVYWGYVGMMEGVLSRITTELGTTPSVVATGGLAPLFAGALKGIDAVDDALTLRGLEIIYAGRKARKAAA